MNSHTNRILLLSGGLDSYIAWHMESKPDCLHIEYNGKYSHRERRVLRRLQNVHDDLDVWFTTLPIGQFEHPDAWLPLRNMLFVSIASYYAETIYLPCQLGEQELPDRSPEFYSYMSDILTKQWGKPISVINPVSDMTKQDMVSWYLRQGLPPSNLLLTYSCYNGKKPCGQCKACFRWWVALASNGIKLDPQFVKRIKSWEGTAQYIKDMTSGKYQEKRAEQTLQFLLSN